jgi:hypothetical protein
MELTAWQSAGCTLAPAGESRSVDIAGMDLVIPEGELIARTEVYFDRSPLAALMTPATP